MKRPRVLLVVGWYYPDSFGGSENYVRLLARDLRAAGTDASIAAPRDGEEPDEYVHEGVPVYRYPVPPARNRGEVGGTRRPRLFGRFEELLRRLSPDIVHFQSFTRGCGLPHLRAAKQEGRKIFMTVHVPGFTCARGDMMRWGRVPCDGRMTTLRCSVCVGHSRWPFPVFAAAAPALVPGIAQRHGVTRAALPLVDRFVAVADWVRAALAANGVPQSKIALSRHGIDVPPARPPVPGDGPLRVAFVGRITAYKGVDVLVSAMRLTRASVHLRIYGGPYTDEDRAYEARLRAAAAGDARISFFPAGAGAASEAFAWCHVAAVPSRWLEAGPYVALEAFAAGRPVVGTDAGGLSELVRNGVDGLLLGLEPRLWAEALERLAADRPLVTRLAAGVRPPRRSTAVAEEMSSLYGEAV